MFVLLIPSREKLWKAIQINIYFLIEWGMFKDFHPVGHKNIFCAFRSCRCIKLKFWNHKLYAAYKIKYNTSLYVVCLLEIFP